MAQPKDQAKIMKVLTKKAPDIEEKLYWELRNCLHMVGADLFLVQYESSSPILIIDKIEIKQYEVTHLGCFNYPFCSEYGCGSN